MTQPEAVFFDCDGTLVDSEVICSRAYVHMFQEFGITLDLAEIFKRFKGVKLYEIIDTINAEYGVNLQKATLEPIYRAEVARLFDSELEVIPGAQALLDAVSVRCAWFPMAQSVRCSTRSDAPACCAISLTACTAATIFSAGSPTRR
ncbi:phosphatase YieH [Klebsiella pneumoniae]|nr:phosphatase YieH [Klebsiella pneumoniae]